MTGDPCAWVWGSRATRPAPSCPIPMLGHTQRRGTTHTNQQSPVPSVCLLDSASAVARPARNLPLAPGPCPGEAGRGPNAPVTTLRAWPGLRTAGLRGERRGLYPARWGWGFSAGPQRARKHKGENRNGGQAHQPPGEGGIELGEHGWCCPSTVPVYCRRRHGLYPHPTPWGQDDGKLCIWTVLVPTQGPLPWLTLACSLQPAEF